MEKKEIRYSWGWGLIQYKVFAKNKRIQIETKIRWSWAWGLILYEVFE